MKLKASSSVLFWLSWILAGAYLVAISEFVDEFYVPLNERLNSVNTAVFLVCIALIVSASCGCCLIFCDVTNIVCVLLYIIPLMVVVPGLCIFALMGIGKAELITSKAIENFVTNDYWAHHKNNKLPRYLAETQVHMSCCGLYGPTDYRNFIYGEACQAISIDVPYSCCNLSTLFYTSHAQILKDTCGAAMLEKGNDVTLSKCHGLFENIFTINASRVKEKFAVSLTDKDFKERSNVCKYTHSTTVKLREEYKHLVYQKGCLPYMSDKTKIIVNGNYVFLISSILLSFTMLFVFLKIWCSSPGVHKWSSYPVESKLSGQTLIIEEAKFHPKASKDPWGVTENALKKKLMNSRDK